MQGILLHRVGQVEVKTGLYFSQTSSRPIKATIKVVEIDIFSQQNLQKQGGIDKISSNKSFFKLKVNENRH